MKKFSIATLALCTMLGVAAQAQDVTDLKFYVQGGSYLGIGVRDLDSARAQTLKLKEERGVEVTSIEQGSPAEQAGMKVGDVVLEFQGEPIQGVDQFQRMVRETPAGRKAKLQVWRNGGNTNLTATVGARKAMAQRMPKIEVPQVYIPDIPRPTTTWRTAVLGVEAEALDGQFAQYFGVADGVLLRSINDGSAAQKAGLKAGDVVTKVGSVDVNSPRELSRQLRDFEGKSAQLTVVREHKEMQIGVSVSAEPARGSNVKSRVEFSAD